MLAQVESRGLPRHLLLGGVVEEVVGHLEGHAQALTIPRQCGAMRARAGERADLARGRQQRGRLGADERLVVVLGERERIVRRELPHLADRHHVRRGGEHAQNLHVAEPDELDHGARVEVVAHDDRHLVREQRVHRRHAPPEHGVIHRVVVHERGEMHELDDGGERRRARLRTLLHFAREEHERGAEHLPLHEQQVAVDLVDERQVGGDDPHELVADATQPVAHERLDVAQRRRPGAAGAHGRAHRTRRSTVARRLLTSRNSMSTANTR